MTRFPAEVYQNEGDEDTRRKKKAQFYNTKLTKRLRKTFKFLKTSKRKLLRENEPNDDLEIRFERVQVRENAQLPPTGED